MQTTLVLLKPDAIKRKIAGRIISRIEDRQYEIIAMKMVKPTEAQAREHYKEHKGKEIYDRICEHMQSGPVIVLQVQAKKAIEGIRMMVGNASLHGTIRGDFANPNISHENAIHASDTEESAKAEIELWFN